MSSNAKCSDSSDSVSSKDKLETYKVYVVTWNVGTSFPDNISLRNLLGLNTSVDVQHLPDIYAIGLQEINTRPQEQMLGLLTKEDAWTCTVRVLLAEFQYVLAKTEQMQGLVISIFVKREHIPFIYDIEAEFTRTGLGGLWGNKGAVSIRFNLYGCGLTFVSAHLAAHDQHLDGRIEDYKQIIENHHYHVARFREIHDHDYVFWFGDLNFRIDGHDSPAEVLEAIKQDRLEALLQRDQLNHVRVNTKEAFQLLHERPPGFPPTFKFKEGTSEYDLKRRPAWTDRILYAVQPLNQQPNMPLAIEQCSYKSHPGYSISDHKPVTSEFTIKLYPNHRHTCVKFREIENWPIDEEVMVEYMEPIEFEEGAHDWIGLFHVDYSGLNDYEAYEYVDTSESPSTPRDSPVDSYFDAPPPKSRSKHQKKDKKKGTSVERKVAKCRKNTLRIFGRH